LLLHALAPDDVTQEPAVESGDPKPSHVDRDAAAADDSDDEWEAMCDLLTQRRESVQEKEVRIIVCASLFRIASCRLQNCRSTKCCQPSCKTEILSAFENVETSNC
jgi:hypothetical protein